METYLSLVNKVLMRLRETQVTSVAETEYSQLIGEFVNEAKQQVEDAWLWSMLYDDIDLAMITGIRTYALTGSNARTKLLDAYNITGKWQMQKYTSNEYINHYMAMTVSNAASPTHYDVYGSNSSGEKLLRFNPVPLGGEVIKFYVYNPQADFTTDSTALLVPAKPVIQLAYLKAINERGEDQGRASEVQEKLANATLSDAIAIDAEHSPELTTWRPA